MEPPTEDGDADFDRLGAFYVPKKAEDIGIRQRTRLSELQSHLDKKMLNEIVVPLVTSKSIVSLRVLDWTVTNYSKRHAVTVEHVDARGNSRLFNIHHEYRAWLRVWRRRLFDPFARRSRIFFHSEDGNWCATTVAQLNFIVFAYSMNVISYVKRHVSDIEKEMNRVLRSKASAAEGGVAKGAAGGGGKRRRTELSEAPVTRCSIFERPMRVVWRGVDDDDDK